MRQIIFLSKHPKEMKTHTIRPSQGQLGFIVDDQFIVNIHKGYWTYVIHLNSGPKKPEEYRDYSIPGNDGAICSSYKILSKNIMCNEHVYIDIKSSSYDDIYLRGFIANILESDLNIISENCSTSETIDRITKKKRSTEK